MKRVAAEVTVPPAVEEGEGFIAVIACSCSLVRQTKEAGLFYPSASHLKFGHCVDLILQNAETRLSLLILLQSSTKPYYSPRQFLH